MRVTGEVGTCGLMIGDGWMRITLCFSALFPCAAVRFPAPPAFFASRPKKVENRSSEKTRKNEETGENKSIRFVY